MKDLNLDIQRGEFLTMLGPSGSGKTTSLMMLAGFEVPTQGDIVLAGTTLRNTPPHKRDIGVVFQNYALFPHMTVEENITFPLSATSFDEVAVVLMVAGPEQRTLPREMFSGLRENISPTITAVATIMILVSVVMLASLELLRRRNKRLRGIKS